MTKFRKYVWEARKSYVLCLLMISGFTAWVAAANISLSGTVKEADSGAPLPGVNIIINDSLGTTTDSSGHYSIEFTANPPLTIVYKFIGYQSVTRQISEITADGLNIDISLAAENTLLNQVTVTAGKYEQPLEEVTVSMEVIKPRILEDSYSPTLENVLDKIPGVNIINKQVNIRGGSGWSYGVGSRVLMLVDGLPLLAGDAGDIKWYMLPMENAEQIEVIKGASSALYGGSALDGIIHIRTKTPDPTPRTLINLSSGFYGAPPDTAFQYWDSPPLFGRFQFLHSRRIGSFEMVASTDLQKNQGYRQGETLNTAKTYLKLVHKPANIPALQYGISATTLIDSSGTFLFWDSDTTPYIPAANTLSKTYLTRVAIDPFIRYVKNNRSHAWLSRYYRTDNKNNTNQESLAHLYFSEYQFRQRYAFTEAYTLNWTSGISASLNKVISDSLYGDHQGSQAAAFTQIDQTVKKVHFSLGSRFESFRIDTFKREYFPLFRSGVNISIGKATSIRASLGQGIRFPSVAERYAATTAGLLRIFPNPELQQETGWSGEIGIRQGYMNRFVKGYVDLAAFWSEYDNMIEFTFGNYDPDGGIGGLGFAAVNVSATRIYGVEINTNGLMTTGNLQHRLLAGYHFITPLDQHYRESPDDTLGTEQFLKYRFRHAVKFNYTLSAGRISIGTQARYNSFMLNIDRVLELLVPGVKRFRDDHPSGDLVIDAFFRLTLTKFLDLSVYVKNASNATYMFVPGNIGAPRSYNVQLSARF